MSKYFAVVLLATLLSSSSAATSQYIERTTASFVSVDSSDVDSVFLAAQGIQAFGGTVPKSFCDSLKKAPSDNLDQLHKAVVIAEAAGCKYSPKNADSVVKQALKSSSARDLYKAVVVASFAGVSFDASAISNKFSSILDGEYSVLDAGYMFNSIGQLDLDADALNVYVELVEDVINQAERTESDDDSSISFEGGLLPTAFIVKGMFNVAALNDNEPKLSEDEIDGLLNYFVSAEYSKDIISASSVAVGLSTLANNKFFKPARVAMTSETTLSPKNSKFKVAVTDALGRDIDGAVAVATVKSATGKTVVSKKTMTKGSTHLVFDMSEVGSRGIYTVEVTGAGKDFIEAAETFSVTYAVGVTFPSLRLQVHTGSSLSKSHDVTYPNDLDGVVSLDDSQRLALEFSVQDAHSKADLSVAQAFVRLTNVDTDAEIFFVASQSSGKYSFSLDVKKEAESFNSESGKYKIDVVLGDATISPSVAWQVATASITFHKSSPAQSDAQDPLKPKPEIQHLFREPEPRPPQVVSLAFTALCLVPILLLLALWVGIGANISSFPFGNPLALVFHLSIGAILLLFVVFWLKLNMFQTLSYLTPLVIVVLFSGRSTLRSVAKNRSQ